MQTNNKPERIVKPANYSTDGFCNSKKHNGRKLNKTVRGTGLKGMFRDSSTNPDLLDVEKYATICAKG